MMHPDPDAPTLPFIINVPVLSDDAVATVQTFLEDLLMEFETFYGDQLHRYYQELDARRREALEPRKNSPSAPIDTDGRADFNDDIPF